MTMLPDKPISVPQDAVEAAVALRNKLNARSAGKYSTGVGLKQVGGSYTGRLALFVYVPEKRGAEDVAESEFVPPEFGGYVTDVVVARPELLDDTARYDPLRGGMEISRERTIADGIFAPPTGTAGTVVKSRGDGGLHLLTNAHVAQQAGLNVYQPGQTFFSPVTDVVGQVSALRNENNPLFLDCATIRLNGSRGAKAIIEEIGPVQGAWTRIPPLGEVVKKRGKRTLLTHGFVVRTIASLFAPVIDQIEFSGSVPFVTVFGGKGDSGSVVLNSSNQVIGLLFGTSGLDLGGGLSSHGLAMPIHNVQEALKVDVAT
ncbi:hypothetical protein ABTY20_08425 [Streptomyces sp. NPDC126497]|uniref:hypothetical protein n=1 Tax=Streptomyces sp. NPDC126497 TaxID=3155313 RepID=UPI0033285D6B